MRPIDFVVFDDRSAHRGRAIRAIVKIRRPDEHIVAITLAVEDLVAGERAADDT
ncbi:hypothetical protein ES703_82487 [subsurface metagenome]